MKRIKNKIILGILVVSVFITPVRVKVEEVDLDLDVDIDIEIGKETD